MFFLPFFLLWPSVYDRYMKVSLESITKWLLVSIFLTLPFSQEAVVFYGVPLYIPELLTLFALVTTTLSFANRKENEEKSHFGFDRWLVFGASLFAFGAVLSFLVNPISLTGLGMLKAWIFFPLLALFLVVGEESSEDLFYPSILCWFAVSLFVTLYSLQYLLLGTLTYDGRLQGSFPSPNYLAIFIAPGILISLFLLLRSFCHEKKIVEKVFFSVTLALFFIVLYFTHSYGVWVGTLAGAALLLFGFVPRIWEDRRRRKVIVLAGATFAIFCLGVLFLEQDSEKWQALVQYDERSSLSSRMMIWEASVKMLSDHPTFGIGMGRFQEVYLEYQKYFPPYLEWAVPFPHNLYLALWLQTGLLGLFGFGLLVSRPFFLLANNSFRGEDSEKQRTVALVLAILILYLVYGLTDTPYFKTDQAFAFCLLLALGWRLLTTKNPLGKG